jgi:hypothetical protein
MSTWSAHIAVVSLEYRKSNKFWSRISLAMFIMTELFITFSTLVTMLQVGTPTNSCIIGTQKTCMILYYLSLACYVLTGVLVAVSTYMKPDERASNCTDIERALRSLSTAINATLCTTNKVHIPRFPDYANIIQERYDYVLKGAPPLAPYCRVKTNLPALHELPVVPAQSTEQLQYWQSAMNAQLNRLGGQSTDAVPVQRTRLAMSAPVVSAAVSATPDPEMALSLETP